MSEFSETFLFFVGCIVLGYCLISIFSSVKYNLISNRSEKLQARSEYMAKVYSEQLQTSVENTQRWEEMTSRLERILDRIEQRLPPP